MEKTAKLFKEFEDKFGFKAYNSILDIFSRLHVRIEELIKSRDNWRNKYFELKRSLKNSGGKI